MTLNQNLEIAKDEVYKGLILVMTLSNYIFDSVVKVVMMMKVWKCCKVRILISSVSNKARSEQKLKNPGPLKWKKKKKQISGFF